MLADRVVQAVATKYFFAFVIVAFFASGALVALSLSLSMYDEHWHLGIIRAYAEQLGPRLQNGTATLGLGEVEYTGSFLYHWLMSYPFRAFAHFWGDGFVTLALLRLTGVVMVTAGLIVWQRALAQIVESRAIVNVTIGCMAALPLLSFTAATVNYDNLLFLLVAAFMFWQFRLIRNQGRVLGDWLWLAAFGFAAAITKYVFLPVFVALALLTLIRYLPELVRALRTRSAALHWRSLAFPGLAFLVTGAFAVWRYGTALLNYGSPDPSCDRVESVAYCMTYGIYSRNAGFLERFDPIEGSAGLAVSTFFNGWLSGVSSTLSWLGIRNEDGVLDTYGGSVTRPLLWITMICVIAFAVLLGRAVAARYRWPILLSIGSHSVALFTLNYLNLLKYGLLFAVSARYFFPYLPGLMLLAIAGLAGALTKLDPRNARLISVSLFLFALVCMTQGAGPITYLEGLEASWLHPDSPIRDFTMWLAKAGDRLMIVGE